MSQKPILIIKRDDKLDHLAMIRQHAYNKLAATVNETIKSIDWFFTEFDKAAKG